MTHDEAMAKVAKLLRLARGNASEHEAAAAAGAAQEIMDRHGIEHAAVELDAPDAPRESIEDFGKVAQGEVCETPPRCRWRTILALKLSRLHGVTIYTSHGRGRKTIEVAGRPSNVGAFRYVYAWAAGGIVRLVDARGRGMGASWRDNFGIGVAETIAARMEKARQETADALRSEASPGVALVRIETAIARVRAEHHEVRAWARSALNLVNVRSSARHDETARGAGRSAGYAVNLNGSARQIGGTRQIAGRS